MVPSWGWLKMHTRTPLRNSSVANHCNIQVTQLGLTRLAEEIAGKREKSETMALGRGGRGSVTRSVHGALPAIQAFLLCANPIAKDGPFPPLWQNRPHDRAACSISTQPNSNRAILLAAYAHMWF